jgi:membrane fusion protein (multidrug efflux system)
MRRIIYLLMILMMLVYTVGCKTQGSTNGGNDKNEVKKVDKDKKQDNESSEKEGKNKKDSKEKDADTDAVPVQVIDAVRGDISSFLLFSSNIDSDQIVDIYPMTSGIIEKIKYDEGDQVKKGSVLAILDDREASINERKSRLNYQQLKAEFERQTEIYRKQMMSKEEYEKFKFNLKKTNLDWDQSKLLLSYTRITSTISGVVSKRYIKVGNKIDMSKISFSVVNDSEKIAIVNIPEQEKLHIFKKQKVEISTGNKMVPGYVKRISPSIDPESGTFKITVQVTDKKKTLAVGQFVNVKIIKKVHKNVILLPKDALIYEGGKIFVFSVDKESIAIKKRVEAGFDDGVNVEIVKGIEEGDKLVTAGKSSLKNKILVKIVEPII